jgi:hypothetical protein
VICTCWERVHPRSIVTVKHLTWSFICLWLKKVSNFCRHSYPWRRRRSVASKQRDPVVFGTTLYPRKKKTLATGAGRTTNLATASVTALSLSLFCFPKLWHVMCENMSFCYRPAVSDLVHLRISMLGHSLCLQFLIIFFMSARRLMLIMLLEAAFQPLLLHFLSLYQLTCHAWRSVENCICITSFSTSLIL